MLALKDCIDMCDLSEQEVAAIAEEENLPPIVAVLVGFNLIRSRAGLEHLRCLLRNRIERAVDRGDHVSAATHLRTYEDFRKRCPQPICD
ncbi:MAG: hypothetical protein JNK92_03940 [Dechloromonas sp.]|nr:hypothetical protein [Dechloromonas sp.]